ncbi:MAG: hypothetical protein WDO14_07200 [Bacteroidota bacterium]
MRVLFMLILLALAIIGCGEKETLSMADPPQVFTTSVGADSVNLDLKKISKEELLKEIKAFDK